MSSVTAPFPSPAAPTRRWSSTQLLTTVIAAAPVLLTAAVFFHPEDTDDATESLAHIADDRTRWIVAHLLEPFSLLLLAVVVALVGWAATGRGRLITRVGGSLAAVGAVSMALIVYAHGEAIRFMTEKESDLTAMERLYDRFYDGMPMVGPIAMLFMVGMFLLGIGLFWTKLVPAWAAAAVAVSPILMLLLGDSTSPQVAALVIGIPMIVGLAAAAKPVATAWTRPR